MVVDTRVEAMVVMDTEAMNTKVDTEVETVVTIDTVNEARNNGVHSKRVIIGKRRKRSGKA
ncbi:hypothetical protein YC2023_084892 [Brassica napus]